MSIEPAPEEVAMVVPRLHGTPGLPQPLAPSDAALIRRILDLRAGHRGDEADRLTALLGDTTLAGMLAAERCLHAAICDGAARADWLRRYPDQADAAAMAGTIATPPITLKVTVGRPLASNRRLRRIAGRLRGWYAAGHDTKVLAAAGTGAGLDGASAYVAGLAAARSGQARRAEALFAATAGDPSVPPALRAAAAVWAARAAQPADRAGWLARAAAVAPAAFYGQLAAHVLQADEVPAPDARLTTSDTDAVQARPAGRRMLALLQIGQTGRAGVELAALWRAASPGAERRAVVLVARVAALPEPSGADATSGGAIQPVAFRPARTPSPRGGLTVDPALLCGLIKVESNFEPHVVSPSGARGLMQLMGATAAHFAGHRVSAAQLDDPGTNMMLGQRYLHYLGDHPRIDHDLVGVLVSYNAGIGNWLRWSEKRPADPLAFIEAIPRDETRLFVQQVLAQSWLAATSLGRRPPGLDSLAAGAFPGL